MKKIHKKFTRAIYGWDNKPDGTIVPNWNEQNIIDYARWMKAQGVSATQIAKVLNRNEVKGKLGGQFRSTGLLKIIENDFHKQREDFVKPPNWGDKVWHDAVPW